MRRIREYSAVILLLIFSCYYSGISLFAHVHVVNGTSVVHSHLGGGSDHNHSDSQYAVIDILSHFQSECAVDFSTVGTPFFQLSESRTVYEMPFVPNGVCAVLALRGPPMA